MEPSVQGTTGSSPIYMVGGQRFAIGSPGFTEAIAGAHSSHLRPRCMCQVEGVEMYVARLEYGYIVKRMPGTGSNHAPGCPSYEPPAELSGLGQVLGSAIAEDPITGETALKLGFPLTKVPGRTAMPPAGEESASASTSGTKLSLRGLLHYLWDQAELTRWHPGFAGKRTWATVRRHLLQAADHKIARGDALRTRLYVPEPFAVEEREAIIARRMAQWQHVVSASGRPQELMLLIGEVKEIVRARYGFKAIIKQMPDQPFAIDEKLHRQLVRRFEPALSLWGASDDTRMVMIATFSVGAGAIPTVHELCLMAVTQQWLPVDNGFDKELLGKLVSERRSFVKALHYNLARRDGIPSAVLIDCSDQARSLHIVTGGAITVELEPDSGVIPSANPWIWRPDEGAMPALPSMRGSSPASPRIPLDGRED